MNTPLFIETVREGGKGKEEILIFTPTFSLVNF